MLGKVKTLIKAFLNLSLLSRVGKVKIINNHGFIAFIEKEQNHYKVTKQEKNKIFSFYLPKQQLFSYLCDNS